MRIGFPFKTFPATPLFCLLLYGAALFAQYPSPQPRIVQAADQSKLAALAGNVHPLARRQFDRGLAPDDLSAERMLLLLGRGEEQEAALSRLIEEQQVRSSPNYHKWLSPAEFGVKFGPADADIQAVTGWLTANGFQVNRVASGRGVVEFSGTAGQVRRAFHTEIHKFAVAGEEHWANASDPMIPAALAPVVKGIVSLHNFPARSLHYTVGAFTRSNSTGEIAPLYTYTPLTYQTFYGLGPADFATIYDVQPLWNNGIDGSGQTIAVVGESNINIQDVRDFRSLFSLTPNDPQVVLNGPDPGIGSDETEALLDVEWSGAVAKGATIKLVVSQSTEATSGVDLSAIYIVDNDLAPVMSESYGYCESYSSAEAAFYYNLWEQAAAQGITAVVSSGDSGAAACDSPNQPATHGVAVSGFASTPFNVAVGGTDFNQASNAFLYWNTANNPLTYGSAKSYIPEVPWNDSCAAAGLTGCATAGANLRNSTATGGGPSSLYSKPSWQIGAAVPQDGKRDLPDVALFSGNGLDFSFYIVCEADQTNGSSCDLNAPYTDFLAVGGTSASAQAFAGVMALVNQYETGQNLSGRQGQAGYVLYNLAAANGASCTSASGPASGPSCVFHDLTTGNNSVNCTFGYSGCGSSGVVTDPSNPTVPAWSAGPGYDMASGLGSIDVQNLAMQWASGNFAPTNTALSITPKSGIVHGQTVSVSVTVTPASGAGTPTGNVALLATLPNGNVQTLATLTLAGGMVTGAALTSLAGGAYTVTAHYAGDGNFAASDSSPVSVQVAPEASTPRISLLTFDPNTGKLANPNAASAAYGSPYLLRIDIANSAGVLCYPANPLACPTGSITLTDKGSPLDGGIFTLNAEGYTEDLAIQLAGGSHNLRAQYTGDGSYNPSAAGAMVTIIPAAISISLSNSLPALVGASVTFSVGMSTQSSGVSPGGTVILYANSVPLGPPVGLTQLPNAAPGYISMKATAVASISVSGNETIAAIYSGDSNYASATALDTVDFRYPLSAFTLTAAPQAVPYGNSVTLTALLDTGNKNLLPTGPVFFQGYEGAIPGTVSYTPTTDANGNSQLQATIAYKPVYSDSISASYYGDVNYVASQPAQATFTVTGGPDFAMSASPASIALAAGQSGTAAISMTQVNGFTAGATFTCSVPATMALSTCQISPASVFPQGAATSGNTTLTIVTTGPASAGLHGLRPSLIQTVSVLFAGILLVCLGRGGKMNLALSAVSAMVLASGCLSCGGGNSQSSGGTASGGTPAGTYSITVTGNSVGATFNLTHTTTVSVIVQ